MRSILDLIMESLKEKSIEMHIQDVIDRHVQPSSYDEQVEIIRELIFRIGGLSKYIDKSRPERYARNYEELIKALVKNINVQSTIFRRL